MLVLTRRKNEKVIIGDNISIEIVKIRGNRIRLGITCPSNIPVHREEVYEAIKRGKEATEQETTDKQCPLVSDQLNRMLQEEAEKEIESQKDIS